MNIPSKIANEVASHYMGNSPAIMVQAIAAMIQAGIERALSACREGIPSMVNHDMPITIDALDMDYIVGQGLIETGYTPDCRLCDCSGKTVVGEIAQMVAQEHFKNSPQALINGMAEIVEQGINNALEQVKIGLQKMATNPYFPKDPRRWNVGYALIAANS